MEYGGRSRVHQDFYYVLGGPLKLENGPYDVGNNGYATTTELEANDTPSRTTYLCFPPSVAVESRLDTTFQAKGHRLLIDRREQPSRVRVRTSYG
jgi:hypothetical protein